MLTRRNFIKSAIIGSCALSVPVLAKSNQYFSQESIDRAVVQGFELFWEAPNGEAIIGMFEHEGALYAMTETNTYAIDSKGRTIHAYGH